MEPRVRKAEVGPEGIESGCEARDALKASKEVKIMTAEDRTPSHEQIATVAYFHWLERGAPLGTPEEDWHRAEHTLAERAGSPREAPSAGTV